MNTVTMKNLDNRLYVAKGVTVPNVRLFNGTAPTTYSIDMGDTGITISGDVLPAGDDSLGNNGASWNNAYVNNVNFGDAVSLHQASIVTPHANTNRHVLQLTTGIVPTTALPCDIGTDDNRFRDIYISSESLHMGNGDITLDGNGEITATTSQGTFTHIPNPAIIVQAVSGTVFLSPALDRRTYILTGTGTQTFDSSALATAGTPVGWCVYLRNGNNASTDITISINGTALLHGPTGSGNSSFMLLYWTGGSGGAIVKYT